MSKVEMSTPVDMRERYDHIRYNYIPTHLIGELLSKRWADNVVAVITLILVIGVFNSLLPGFFSAASATDMSRQFAEFGLVVLGLTIVMISGGIDVSVGSVFAVSVLATLVGMNVWELPVAGAFLIAVAVGVCSGLLNGYLIGYLRLRAFLTTLVTLVIIRSLYEILYARYSVPIVASFPESSFWDFLGFGLVGVFPPSFLLVVVIAIATHIVLSRMRPGWHLVAVGGARRSAHNAGINVRSTICFAYVTCSTMVAIAGFLYAARLGSAGADTGLGLELSALTAAVLGGNSLGGGKGSVFKAVIGAVLVLILTNGLVTLGIPGPVNALILGTTLIAAVFIDVRWLKNKDKLLTNVYVSPIYFKLDKAPDTAPDSRSPYALNDKLRNVELIGLGIVEGPEDVILDADDNLYCGTRHGTIHKFDAPDYERHAVLAHIGGHPLGLAIDRDGNIVTCVAGMGLYKVSMDGVVTKMSDETNRNMFSIVDDSRLRMPDDLDIAPDGRVFFSDFTIRYAHDEWPLDSIESRGNGRVICYDPRDKSTRTVLRNLRGPNGVCVSYDGQSVLIAETWGCCVKRYWFHGPNRGKVESVLPNLPGHPDNINRASDGGYWMSLVGMRTPAVDLALRMPSFRHRMTRQVAPDKWLFPNINTGCVLKLDSDFQVTSSLWDMGGVNHPMITSMREHKGSLFLGGISNNRIGRYRIPGADPDWTSIESYWGQS